MRLGGALLLVAAVPFAAAADTVAPAKDPAPGSRTVRPPSSPPPSAPAGGYSHQGMFMASLRLGVGLRAIIPYDKTDFCGEADSSTSTGNAPVCSGRAPFSFDLELGYGLSRRIDLFAEVRLGIEADFAPTALTTSKDGPHPLHISPGARFFFSDAKSTKLFTTAQIVLDFTGYEDAAGNRRGTDFGLKNLSGIWLDLDQGYGFYAYLGETATFSRWWMFELDVGVGVQARYH
ncbi:MAG: hypothetical protein JNL83_18305 [Myxococcales bacterium]|nr:hypothetical protein [Myxococcales bacterium]